MRVPFRDLGAENAEISVAIDEAVTRVLRSGRYLFGAELESFEAAFASYVGARHCVGLASGHDALRMALAGLGVGAGDEVIVPANTFVATWLAVRQVGATPVAVEPDEATMNLAPAGVEAAVTDRTRAVVAVHLYGQPADMAAICAIAARHGLAVVEDAAQAHGARCGGRRVGALGSAAAWSFYPTKNLGGVGDGGAVTTDDDGLAATLRSLRRPGTSGADDPRWVAASSRLDEIQAAVLLAKLAHLDDRNARRRAVAGRYLAALHAAGAGAGIVAPAVPDWAEPVWHQFVVRSARRDNLARRLEAAGVATMVHYPSPPAAYGGGGEAAGTLSARLAGEVLSLPIGPELSDAQVAHVAEQLTLPDG